MIYYNTSNDKISKIIVKWCKDNNYIFSFDTKDKERNYYTYPFTIVAPSYQEEDLLKRIEERWSVATCNQANRRYVNEKKITEL